jgi:hypothetical protein
MKLAVLAYNHNSGTDIILHPVPDDWSAKQAEEYTYNDLVAQYGKCTLEEETLKYGGVEHRYFINADQCVYFERPDGLTEKFCIKVVPR